MNEIDEFRIGTAEAAVRSCVNLFARLFETPEDYVACYLDMYYQLRLRWEEEKHAAEVNAAGADAAHPQRPDEGSGREAELSPAAHQRPFAEGSREDTAAETAVRAATPPPRRAPRRDTKARPRQPSRSGASRTDLTPPA